MKERKGAQPSFLPWKKEGRREKIEEKW